MFDYAAKRRALTEAGEILDLFEGDPSAVAESEAGVRAAREGIQRLEMTANFTGQFDSHNAILSINAGAGGVDAADWTQMLARMYLRWAESHDLETRIIEQSEAEEAGLKSITFFVRGPHAYGMLEGERGVHRLVRLSPFDAAHRRHTSLAAVDVLPEVEPRETGAEIKPHELR